MNVETNKVLQHHRDVWTDASHREMAIHHGDDVDKPHIERPVSRHRNWAIQSQRNYAYYILQLEQYNGGGGDLRAAALRSRAAMRDVVGGGDRDDFTRSESLSPV